MSETSSPAILQRYHLLRKIATGGMAEVYLAEQTGAGGFKKRVAIKRILPQFAEDQKFIEMFLDEARVAAMFHHPNLIQIYELGEVDGLLCMVMEYVRGLSLSELIKRTAATGQRKFPPGVAARILVQACEGLDYAHDFADPDSGQLLGLVHRDVSPQNILLSKEGIAKVMDFGIAKAAGNLHHTSTGALKGKLAYMPPEQLNGKPLDRRADVWALGIVLYELLAGRRPFVGESEASVFRAILLDPMPPIEALAEEVPVALRNIVNGALARDLADRTPSAGSMALALEGWLSASGDRTSPADVSAWLKPLLPTNPSEAANGAPVITPSNITRASVLRSKPPHFEQGQSEPSLDVPMDFTKATAPPAPAPASRAWLVAGGACAVAVAAVAFAWITLGHQAPQPPPPEPRVAERPSVAPTPGPPSPSVAPAIAAARVPELPAPAPIRPARSAPAVSRRRIAKAAHARPSPASSPRTIDAASPETGGRGSLSVNTDPWSNVTIDGKDLGSTPLPTVELTSGRHLMVCTNPDSGLVHRETVTIPPGGKIRRFIQLSGADPHHPQ